MARTGPWLTSKPCRAPQRAAAPARAPHLRLRSSVDVQSTWGCWACSLSMRRDQERQGLRSGSVGAGAQLRCHGGSCGVRLVLSSEGCHHGRGARCMLPCSLTVRFLQQCSGVPGLRVRLNVRSVWSPVQSCCCTGTLQARRAVAGGKMQARTQSPVPCGPLFFCTASALQPVVI